MRLFWVSKYAWCCAMLIALTSGCFYFLSQAAERGHLAVCRQLLTRAPSTCRIADRHERLPWQCAPKENSALIELLQVDL